MTQRLLSTPKLAPTARGFAPPYCITELCVSQPSLQVSLSKTDTEITYRFTSPYSIFAVVEAERSYRESVLTLGCNDKITGTKKGQQTREERSMVPFCLEECLTRNVFILCRTKREIMETVREENRVFVGSDGGRAVVGPAARPGATGNNLLQATTTESSELVKNSVDSNKAGVYHQYVHRQPVPPFSSPDGHYGRLPPKVTPGKHLQSVVTTSFSVDGASLSPGRHQLAVEHREASVTPSPWRKDSVEERSPPPSIVVTTAPTGDYPERVTNHCSLPISRSYSTTTIDSYNSLPMKRNFFHHVQSNQPYGGLPPDFVPPKRTKSVSSSRKEEVILAARPEFTSDAHQWYSHPSHWQLPTRGIQSYHEEAHMRSQSFPSPPPHWASQKHHSGTNPAHHHQRVHEHYRGQQIPAMAERFNGRAQESWRRSEWYPTPLAQSSQYYDPQGRRSQQRDDMESRHPMVMQREMRESFDEDGSRDSANSAGFSNRNAIFRPNTSLPVTNRSNDKMKLVVEAASFTEGRENFARKSKAVNYPQSGSQGHGMLLAMPEDKASLSETLCVVREVSWSTQEDSARFHILLYV